ncbi:NAD(P)H-dependent oxidoreductase [Sphingomonas swuensis]|uniref:NAD(P)H-dependent oxidoreductase n=1 Tax=Sphingomonas swuensis TaxID=977800 RepID=A0ABP7TFQ2_9SPHN
MTNPALTAVAINCTLKKSDGEPSSTDKMIELVAGELGKHGVTLTETLRLADYRILPGVESDMGDGDQWPELRAKILAADVLIFGTPIWLGQLSSIGKSVLERMDAFLSEADDKGRYPSFGKLVVAAIVGNEDGAHRVTADLFQGLNDVGWTVPPAAACYWVGEAMHKTDFKDLPKVPDEVQSTAKLLASSTAHLARLLKSDAFPGVDG